MTEQERQQLRQLWAQRVEVFLDSGMSQKTWCEQHGLRPNQLGYWLRKFRSEQLLDYFGKDILNGFSKGVNGAFKSF